MKRSYLPALMAIVIAMVFSAFILMPSNQDRVQAAPPAVAPTPAAYNNANDNAQLATFFKGVRVTSDVRKCINLAKFDSMDLQLVIIQPSPVNTVTVRMSYSNDGTNYVTGPSIAAASVVSLNTLTIQPLFGLESCIEIDVSNAQTLTASAIGVTD